MQLKRSGQQAWRQSHVRFQTPEANVVSEAADPHQDERNNSSKAGSTPFQAKSIRRVSFAATELTTDRTSDPQTAAETTLDSSQIASASALAKRRLDSDIDGLQPPVEQPAASTDAPFAAFGAQQLTADATAHALCSDASDSDDGDADDSGSIGTVSVAAGSTPYQKLPMPSAALKRHTPSMLLATARDNVDHAEGADLSSMMAGLLSPQLDAQHDAASQSEGHIKVSRVLAPSDHQAIKACCSSVSEWPLHALRYV